ncbi:sulfurtransferase [Microbacteriaceae bacterium VKM Ac-2854]|nr:sulfurtransferase [Microbacteriaceae bacterium VKM Ac-2854]
MTYLASPVVSTQWLADHLGSDDLVVLDASVLLVRGFDGRMSYLTGEDQFLVDGHVPGAVFADVLEHLSDPDGRYPFTRPSRSAFEAALSELGVDADSTVVVYDSGVGQWAARVWWLLRGFGFDAAAVLDGGMSAWRTEERPVEVGHVPPRADRRFVAGSERARLWADRAEVERIVSGTAPGALVCAAPAKEFTGESSQRARAGHIPGSIGVPAARLVDRQTNTLLPPERLRELFTDVLDAPRIVLYCGGGIAAAADALVLTLLGARDVAVYDGSLAEWADDPALPLVVTV